MRGFKVPVSLLHSGLKHAPLTVCLYLLFRQKNGVADLTYGQIAEALGLSEKTVFNAVRQLQAKGMVKPENKKRGGRIAATLFRLISQPTGFWVWAEARLFELHLSASDLQVYLAVRCYANGHGFAWPSIRTLQNDTGLARQTILRAIRRLSMASLLRRQRRRLLCGRLGRNLYKAFSCAERETLMRVYRKKKACIRKQRSRHIEKHLPLSAYHGRTEIASVFGPAIRC